MVSAKGLFWNGSHLIFPDNGIITFPQSVLHSGNANFATPQSKGERVMAIDSKLKLAADSIQDAKRRLERAKDDADDDYEIRQAIKILDEAAEYIRGAVSELTK
jgi:hypothetical protein